MFISKTIVTYTHFKHGEWYQTYYAQHISESKQFLYSRFIISWSSNILRGPWLYGSWIYNYLCNQCLSPLMLWVRISIRTRCRTLCDKVCQWLATSWWFSPGPPVSSTNKTDRHDITEILLKMALNTIKQTKQTI